MGCKRFRRLLALLVTTVLLISVLSPAAGYSDVKNKENEFPSLVEDTYTEHEDRFENQTSKNPQYPEKYQDSHPRKNSNITKIGEVTLISGQTVEVYKRDSKKFYSVDSEQTVHKVNTSQGTYIFPQGVNFKKFDSSLFNVDLLMKQGLEDSETSSLPLIISRGENGISPQSLGTMDGFSLGNHLSSIDSFSGEIQKEKTENFYQRISRIKGIEVHLDQKYRVALNDSVEAIAGEKARRNYRVDGDNITVAVLDTGIDNEHPDLDEGKVILEKDFTGEGTVEDKYGHGTHVAGIIAGDGDASDGKYMGVAPNASLINARVFDTQGSASLSSVIKAIEYSVNNSADIISMSFGGPPTIEPLRQAVKEAIDKGVVVSVSAGNSGPYMKSVESPGVVKKAITVGAVNDENRNVMTWSSRGPTKVRSLVKPDVVAPGVSVISARAKDTSMGNKVNEKYTSASGTSMSAPHVSGAAALVLDKHPNWSPSEVKSALTNTADPVNGTEAIENLSVYHRGSGMINVTDAVGTDYIVKNSTVSFGEIAENGTEHRDLVIKNVGNETGKLSIKTTSEGPVSSVEGNKIKPVSSEINVSEITIRPNEKAIINLSVDVPNETGIYSGKVLIKEKEDAGSEVFRVPFGFTRNHKVIVEKKGINSSQISNDILVVNPYRSGAQSFLRTFGDDGKVEFKGTGGYTFKTGGIYEEKGQPVILSKEKRIKQYTKLSFDEERSYRHYLDTSQVREKHGEMAILGTSINIGDWDMMTTMPGSTIVRMREINDLGSISIEYLLAPEKHIQENNPNLDSPVVYNVEYGINEFEYNEARINTSQLNKYSYRYRRTQDTEYKLRFMPKSRLSYVWEIGDRVKQKFYTKKKEPGLERLMLGEGKYLHLSDNTFENLEYRSINKHPYTAMIYSSLGEPYEPSVKHLEITAYPLIDRLSNTLYNNKTVDKMVVKYDGKVVEEVRQNASKLKFHDSNVSDVSEISVRAIGRNSDSDLSSKTTKKISFKPDFEKYHFYTPPNHDFDIAGLNNYNTVSSGKITIYASAFSGLEMRKINVTNETRYISNGTNITKFGFSYSTGSGWKNATVEKLGTIKRPQYEYSVKYYKATLDIDGNVKPDLRITTGDEFGTEVVTTVEDAFQVDENTPSSEVELKDYEVVDKSVPKIDPVELNISVENIGGVGSMTYVPIKVDGELRDSDFLWAEPGNESTAKFSIYFDEIGNHTIQVGELEKTEIEIFKTSVVQAIIDGGERDDKADFYDIQKAIEYWTRDKTVPGTGGEKVDFETLQKIIRLWVTNS